MRRDSYLDPLAKDTQKAALITLRLSELRGMEQTDKVKDEIKKLTRELSTVCDEADRLADKEKNKKHKSVR